jgi:hypothetical protein
MIKSRIDSFVDKIARTHLEKEEPSDKSRQGVGDALNNHQFIEIGGIKVFPGQFP